MKITRMAVTALLALVVVLSQAPSAVAGTLPSINKPVSITVSGTTVQFFAAGSDVNRGVGMNALNVSFAVNDFMGTIAYGSYSMPKGDGNFDVPLQQLTNLPVGTWEAVVSLSDPFMWGPYEVYKQTITITCNSPNASFNSISSVGPGSSPNSITVNYSPNGCNQTTQGQLEILDGATVVRTATIASLSPGNNAFNFTSLPFTSSNSYTARFTGTPLLGSPVVISEPFNFACGTGAVNIGAISNVGPTASPNTISVSYTPVACAGSANTTLEIIDGSTVVRSIPINGISGASTQKYNFTSLPYTSSNNYTAKITYTPSSGPSVVQSQNFSFACGTPSGSFNAITNVGPAFGTNSITTNYSALACSGSTSALLEVLNGGTVVQTVNLAGAVGSGTKTFNWTPPLPYTATNNYTARVTYTPTSGTPYVMSQAFSFACGQTDFAFNAYSDVGPNFSPNKIRVQNNPLACSGASSGTMTVKDLNTNAQVVGPVVVNGINGAIISDFTFASLPYSVNNNYEASVTYTPSSGTPRTRTVSLSFPCATPSATFQAITDVGPSFGTNKILVDYSSYACNGLSSGKLEILDGSSVVRTINLATLAGASQTNTYTFSPLPETATNVYTARVTYTPAIGSPIVVTKVFTMTCTAGSVSFSPITQVGPSYGTNSIQANYTPKVCAGLTNGTLVIKDGATTVRTISLNGITANSQAVNFTISPVLPYTASNSYTAQLTMTPEFGSPLNITQAFSFACGAPAISFIAPTNVGPTYSPNQVQVQVTPLVCSGTMNGTLDVFEVGNPTPVRNVSINNITGSSTQTFSFTSLPYTATNDYSATATYTSTGGATAVKTTPIVFPCGAPQLTINAITNVGPTFTPNTIGITATPYVCTGSMTANLDIFDGATIVTSATIPSFTGTATKTFTLASALPYTATNSYNARVTLIGTSGGNTVKTQGFNFACPTPTATFLPIVKVGGGYSPNEISVTYQPQVCSGNSNTLLEILDGATVVASAPAQNNLPASSQTLKYQFPTLANNATNTYTARFTATAANAPTLTKTQSFSFACPDATVAFQTISNVGPNSTPNSIKVDFGPQACTGSTNAVLQVFDGATEVRNVAISNIASASTQTFNFSSLPFTSTNNYSAKVTYTPTMGVPVTKSQTFSFGCDPADVTINPITDVGPSFATNNIKSIYTPKACSGITTATLKVYDGATVVKTASIANISAASTQSFDFSPLPYTASNSYTAEVTYTPSMGPAVVKTLGFTFLCGQVDFAINPITKVGPSFGTNEIPVNYQPLACSGQSNYLLEIFDGATVVRSVSGTMGPAAGVNNLSFTPVLSYTASNSYSARVTATPAKGTVRSRTQAFSFSCGTPDFSFAPVTDVGPTFTPNVIKTNFSSLACSGVTTAHLDVLDGASIVRSVDVSGVNGSSTQTFNFASLPYTASNSYTFKVTYTPTSGTAVTKTQSALLACPSPTLTIQPISQVGPGFANNSIAVKYNAEVCSGNANATLNVLDGATTVRTVSLTNLAPKSTTNFVFGVLPYTATNAYTAKASYVTNSSGTITASQNFSFGCGAATASIGAITNVGPGFTPSNVIPVDMQTLACSGATTATLEVLENGVTIRSVNVTPASGAQNVSFTALPYSASNAYTAKLTLSPANGAGAVVTKDFVLDCGAPTVDIVTPTNVGPGYSPNQIKANYTRLACSGNATAQLDILDGATVVRTVNMSGLNATGPYNFTFASLPYSATNNYTAKISVTPTYGQVAQDTQAFNFACGKPAISIQTPTEVGPSFTPNKVNVSYTPLACNGPTTLNLAVKDGGSAVRTIAISNVTASGLQTFSFTPSLPDTATNVYDAEVTATPASGTVATDSKTFSFNCADAAVAITDTSKTGPSFGTNEVQASITPRACSGAGSAKLEIIASGSVVKTVNLSNVNSAGTKLFSFAALPYTSDNAYTAKVTYTPSYGNAVVTQQKFSFSCGVPSAVIIPPSSVGPTYNPNVIASNYTPLACSGTTTATLKIYDGASVVRSLSYGSPITGAGAISFNVNPLPYTGTNNYTAEIVYTPTQGGSLTVNKAFTFPCASPSAVFSAITNVGPSLPNNSITANITPQSCSGSTSAKLDVIDKANNAVVRTVLINSIMAQGDQTFTFASLPYSASNSYRAVVTMTPSVGSVDTKQADFTFACGTASATINTPTKVGPSFTPNELELVYAPLACSGKADVNWTIEDGASVVRSTTMNGITGAGPHKTTFTSLPYTASNSYTAKATVNPADGPTFTVSRVFSFACEAASVNFDVIKDVGPLVTPSNSITVNSVHNECNGLATAALTIKDGNTVVRTINASNLLSGAHKLSFAPLPYTANNTYTAELSYSPVAGGASYLSKEFAFGCGDVSVNFGAGNVGPQFTPNSIQATYTPFACTGAAEIDLTVSDGGSTVHHQTLTNVTNTTQPLTFNFDSLALNAAESYHAQIKVTPFNGDIKTFDTDFAIPCIALTGDFDSSKTSSTDNPFMVFAHYKAEHTCNGVVSANLTLKDGSTTVFNESKSGLGLTKGNSNLSWSFSPLEFGKTYKGTLSLTTNTGKSVTVNRDFVVDCPNEWDYESLSANADTLKATATHHGAHGCNGTATATVKAYDRGGIERASTTKTVTLTDVSPVVSDINFTHPLSQWPGLYTINSTMTDAKGNKHSRETSMRIACTPPTWTVNQWHIQRNADMVFSVDGTFNSPYECHANSNIKLEIIGEDGSAVAKGQSNTLQSAMSTPVTIAFTPVEPGRSYTAKFTVYYSNGESFVQSMPISVACPMPDFNAVVDLSNVTVTPKWFACHLPSSFSTIVNNGNGDEVGRSTTSVTKVESMKFATPYSIPLNQRGGQYRAAITLIDKLGQNSTHEFDFTYPCAAPNISEVVEQKTSEQYDPKHLLFNFSTVSTCNGNTQVNYDLRDSAGTVVKQLSPVGVFSAGRTTPIDLVLPTLAKGKYSVHFEMEDAADHRMSVERKFALSCKPASLIGMGYVDASRTQFGALIDAESCDFPLTANVKLTSQTRGVAPIEMTGPIDVMNANDVTKRYEQLRSLSLASVPDGSYTVTMTVSGASNLPVTFTSALTIDRSGPVATFVANKVSVKNGGNAKVNGVNQLAVDYQDASLLLRPIPTASAVNNVSTLRGGINSLTADGTRALKFDGWIVDSANGLPGQGGYVEVKSDSTGKLFAVPFVSRYLSIDNYINTFGNHANGSVMAGAHNGFHAIGDAHSLSNGSYSVTGIVIDVGGFKRLEVTPQIFVVNNNVEDMNVVFTGPERFAVKVTPSSTQNRLSLVGERKYAIGHYDASIELIDSYGTRGNRSAITVDLNRPSTVVKVALPYRATTLSLPVVFTMKHLSDGALHKGNILGNARMTMGSGALTIQGASVSGSGTAMSVSQLKNVDGQYIAYFTLPNAAFNGEVTFSVSDDDLPDVVFAISAAESGVKLANVKADYALGKSGIDIYGQPNTTATCTNVVGETNLTSRQLVGHACVLKWKNVATGLSVTGDGSHLGGALNAIGTTTIDFDWGLAITDPATEKTAWEFIGSGNGELTARDIAVPNVVLRGDSSINLGSSIPLVVGNSSAGTLVVSSEIDNIRVSYRDSTGDRTATTAGASLTTPVSTANTSVWSTMSVPVSVQYGTSTFNTTVSGTVVPKKISIVAVDGPMAPRDTALTVSLKNGVVNNDTYTMGALTGDWEAQAFELNGSKWVPVGSPFALDSSGVTSANLPITNVGQHALKFVAKPVNHDIAAFTVESNTIKALITDAGAISASLASANTSGALPFKTIVKLVYAEPAFANLVSEVRWEVADENGIFHVVSIGDKNSTQWTVSMLTSGTKRYRASIINGSSNNVFTTAEITLNAYDVPKFAIEGPTSIYIGQTGQLTARSTNGASLNYEWHVVSNQATERIVTGDTLVIDTSKSGAQSITVFATMAGEPVTPSSPKRAYGVMVKRVTLSNPVVVTDRNMEVGHTYNIGTIAGRLPVDAPQGYSVRSTLTLPNGQTIQDPTTVSYTPKLSDFGSGMVIFRLESWIEGDADSHVVGNARALQWTYNFANNWKMYAYYSGKSAPAVVSLHPFIADYKQAIAMGREPITYAFDTPQSIPLRTKGGYSTIVYPQKGSYVPSVTVSDSRGNTRVVQAEVISLDDSAPFTMDFGVTFDDRYQTAPARAVVSAVPRSLPNVSSVAETKLFVDGQEVPQIIGGKWAVNIVSSGSHLFKLTAKTNWGAETFMDKEVQVYQNQPPACALVLGKVYDGMNILKANCTDIDGRMVSAGWTVNGAAIDNRNFYLYIKDSQLSAGPISIEFTGTDDKGSVAKAVFNH